MRGFVEIAEKDLAATLADRGFAAGVQTHDGFVTYEAVARSLDLEARFRALEP